MPDFQSWTMRCIMFCIMFSPLAQLRLTLVSPTPHRTAQLAKGLAVLTHLNKSGCSTRAGEYPYILSTIACWIFLAFPTEYL